MLIDGLVAQNPGGNVSPTPPAGREDGLVRPRMSPITRSVSSSCAPRRARPRELLARYTNTQPDREIGDSASCPARNPRGAREGSTRGVAGVPRMQHTKHYTKPARPRGRGTHPVLCTGAILKRRPTNNTPYTQHNLSLNNATTQRTTRMACPPRFAPPVWWPPYPAHRVYLTRPSHTPFENTPCVFKPVH